MQRMPSVFISHGAPTFALDPGLAGAQLASLARVLDKPTAILVVSPHWMTHGVQVTGSQRPRTLHDFGGFDRALYDLEYPVAGDPVLAQRIADMLRDAGWDAVVDEQRGLDHGAWVPLLHMFPDANVPVVQVSLPFDTAPAGAFELGQALAPLASENVLVIGSGSLTHNLYEFRMGQVEEAAYAREFSSWIRQAVLEGSHDRLIHALERAPHAARAHPTSEHFLPLLVAAGAAVNPTPSSVLDGGIRHGVLAMESYVFGQSIALKAEEALT